MRTRHFFSAVGLTVGLLALLAAPPAFSQAVSGTITGVVTDPSNAAIAGAMVVIRNIDTTNETTRETDESGR